MKNNRANGMIDNVDIGRQIRAAQFKQQVTTAQLAYRLGEDNGYVRRLKGGNSCSATTAKRVADALGMGLHRFLELK